MNYEVRISCVDKNSWTFAGMMEIPKFEDGKLIIETDNGGVSIFYEKHVVAIECEKKVPAPLIPPIAKPYIEQPESRFWWKLQW